MKRTPLHAAHERLGGRLVEFAGFRMPVQYTSIRDEHRAVREAAGLFDVSHMGQIHLEGPSAVDAAGSLLSRPVSSLRVGRARYALLCNEQGGVVDDVLVHRLDEDAVMLCVNAANRDKDLLWIRDRVPPDALVSDRSEETALLALQGPASPDVLCRVAPARLRELAGFAFERLEVAGRPALVARTGYTGADGYEIYCAADDAERLFETLLAEGKPLGLEPAGLGARDTLRLEAALPLYGHELDDTTSPLEAGLSRFVDVDTHRFVGAEAIRRRRDAGHPRRLVGFEVTGRGIARAGHPITCDGAERGVVTSGAPSPTLGRPIGLGYVPPALAEPGTGVQVRIRGRDTAAVVVETPFVRGRTAGARMR